MKIIQLNEANMSDVQIYTKAGKCYENCIEYGQEVEFLDGVGLRNGCYCKHYCQMRDLRGESLDADVKDTNGNPCLQHYCQKSNTWMGFAYCCDSRATCFEEGKSAGVKRILNKIRKERGYVK